MMPARLPSLLLVAALSALSAPSFGDEAPAPRQVDVSKFGDTCTGIEAYPAFRAELERVVAARDGAGLRALFHPGAAMRVHGIGFRPGMPDAGFDRPEAAPVWRELEEILAAGCARSGEHLLLPGTAVFSDLDPGTLIVLRADAIRREPKATGKVLGHASVGQVYTFVTYDSPSGWTSILLDDGTTAYLPTAALRSAFAIRLELVFFEGAWRIMAFSDGI